MHVGEAGGAKLFVSLPSYFCDYYVNINTRRDRSVELRKKFY